MSTIKTKQTEASVKDFINSFVATEERRKDSSDLIKIMTDHTGYEPKMWGPSIIGFGSYHYKSEKSTQEADWPLVGFSPRKAAISLYVYMGTTLQKQQLDNLGKFKMGKACIYVKKLSDINIDVLKILVSETVKTLNARYGIK